MSTTSKASSILSLKSSESAAFEHGLKGAALEHGLKGNDDTVEKQLEYSSRTDEWDGPLDAANPQNWPAWKRSYHTLVPSAAAACCAIASSIYTPAVGAISNDFNVPEEIALLPFAFYILGLGFGPLIAAPLSEEFGRRMVYRTTVPIWALFTLGGGLSNNIAALTITRFFAGVFGGPSLVIGSASISDLYPPARRALPMTIYLATPFCGPAIGPLVGGYATQDLSWRWTFWANLFIAVAVILLILPMQETYKQTLLRHRRRERGLTQSNEADREISTIAMQFTRTALIRPIHMGFTEPIVALVAVYIALNFATLYSFFAAFPNVLQNAYGFDLGQIGLTFLAIGVGALLASLIVLAVDIYVFKAEAAKKGKVTPEHRLYLAMVASILIPSSLFWFGWTARADVHWICPVIAEVFFSCGNMLAFNSFVLYLADTYGARYTASAMTANTFLRYLLASTFPLWINYMYRDLGTAWATSVLGFLSLLMTPIPWIFYAIGPRLRQRKSFYHPSAGK